MKKKIIYVLILIMLIIGTLLTFDFNNKTNNTKQKETTSKISYSELFDKQWIRGENVLYFASDGEFYYHDTSGSPVDDYDLCSVYTIKNNIINLTCDPILDIDTTFKIINLSKYELVIEIDDQELIFTNDDIIEYEIYKVGYLQQTSKEIIINDIDELNDYLNKDKNNIYDGQGNIIGSSVDSILNNYSKEYFIDKYLIIKYVPVNSGSIKITDVSLEYINDAPEISYSIEVPEVSTEDMNGYYIVVSIKR